MGGGDHEACLLGHFGYVNEDFIGDIANLFRSTFLAFDLRVDLVLFDSGPKVNSSDFFVICS